MRQIVLDTETTGLEFSEGHRIIEIGCIELVNRKFTGKRFHHYLNPEREIDNGALAVHGITTDFLKDKPKFEDILDDFLNFITGAEVIIHNAPFDVGFINYEIGLINKKYKTIDRLCQIFDTLVLAKKLHIGQRNNLDALCKRYSVDNTQRDLHGALLDAHLLAQVYLAMTGGQGSLFEESTQQEIRDEVLLVRQHAGRKRELRILAANTDELVIHELHLKKMAEKGKCLWVE